jgi:hypothetical protein
MFPPVGARWSDFKCTRCFDKGTRQTACPDGRIGCAVYHSTICECEAGQKLKDRAEFEKNQLSLDFNSGPIKLTLNADNLYDSVITMETNINSINSTFPETKEKK